MYHRCTLLACVAMYAMGAPVMQQKDTTKLVEGGKKARTDLRNYFAVEEERIMIRSMKDYEVQSELHLRAACPEQSSAMW